MPASGLAQVKAESLKRSASDTFSMKMLNGVVIPLVMTFSCSAPKIDSAMYSPNRQTEIESFAEHCETGDLILQAGITPFSKLSQTVNHSRVDHVAMILRHPELDGQPFVVSAGRLDRQQAVGNILKSPDDIPKSQTLREGPYMLPLWNYLRFIQINGVHRIVWRRLRISPTDSLMDAGNDVKTIRHQMSMMLSELYSVWRSPAANPAQLKVRWIRIQLHKSVFRQLLKTSNKPDSSISCTESVIAAMDDLGITATDPLTRWQVTPGDFEANGKVEMYLLPGRTFDSECMINIPSEPIVVPHNTPAGYDLHPAIPSFPIEQT